MKQLVISESTFMNTWRFFLAMLFQMLLGSENAKKTPECPHEFVSKCTLLLERYNHFLQNNLYKNLHLVDILLLETHFCTFCTAILNRLLSMEHYIMLLEL